MTKFTKSFFPLFIVLFFMVVPSKWQLSEAQCVIDLGDINVTPPSGSAVCANSPIILPELNVLGNENDCIIWAVYTCQPSIASPDNPILDPCNTGNALIDAEGSIIFGAGEAILGDVNFGGNASLEIVIVPYISAYNNVTGECENGFDPSCTGIDLSVDYPTFTLLDPDNPDNSDLCSGACEGITVVNDFCANPTELTLTNATYGSFNNVCATSTGDPIWGDDNFPICFDDGIFQNSVWMSFVGNGGTYTLEVANCAASTEAQLVDSQIAVFSGACDDLVLVACDEDDGPGSLSQISGWLTEIGTTYWVAVDGYDGQEGEFCLNVLEEIEPPVCEPSYGTVTTSVTANCANNGYDVITALTDEATDGYTSVVLYTNNSGEILFVTANNEMVSLPAPNDYVVYAVNYANVYADVIAPVIEVGQFVETLENMVNEGVVCATEVLSNGNYTLNDVNELPECVNCGAAVEMVNPIGVLDLCPDNEVPIFSFDGETVTFDGFNYVTTFLVTNTDGEILTVTEMPSAAIVLPAPITYVVYAVNYAEFETVDLFTNVNDIGSDFCGALSDAVTVNLLEATNDACVSCEAQNAIVSGPIEAVVCEGLTLGEVTTDVPSIDGYTTMLLLTNGSSETIVAMQPPGEVNTAALDLTVGEYCVQVLHYNNEAEELVNTAIESTGTVTGLADAINGACAVLSVGDYCITVLDPSDYLCSEICFANAGVLSVLSDSTTTCEGGGIIFEVIGSTDLVGYTTVLVLTDVANNMLTYQTADDAVSPTEVGNYQVFALTYQNEDETAILAAIEAGGAIEADALPEGWSSDWCFDVGLPINMSVLDSESLQCLVCEAEVGTANLVTGTSICAGQQSVVTVTGNNTNEGYVTIFAPTVGGNFTTNVFNEGNFTFDVPGQTYEVYVINYESNFESAIIDVVNAGGTIDELNAITIDGYAVCADVEMITIEVLSEEDIACACLAETGAFVIEGSNMLCPVDAAAVSIVYEGAATDGFTSVLVIAALEGTEQTVITTASEMVVDFNSLGEGRYCVHALNYETTAEAEVMAAVTASIGNDFAQLVFEISMVDACLNLDTDCQEINVLAENDLACLDQLTTDNLNLIPTADGLSYTVYFEINGGTGSYVVDGNAIVGLSFTSAAISCGTPYSFEVSDDIVSGTVIVDGLAPCDCPTSAGAIVGDEAVLVCSTDVASISAEGSVLADNDALHYILHSEAASPVASQIVINTIDGVFAYDNNLGLLYNTAYYVTAVAGPVTGGAIDLANECTSFSNALEVVFLAPLQILIDEDCDWEFTGDFTVTGFISGGLPAYDNTATYSIDGDLEDEVAYNESFQVVFSEGQTTQYEFLISDGACDDMTNANETFDCYKTPIDLLRFEGEATLRGNLIKWATASEVDNEYFALERSVDGINFFEVNRIESSGSSIVTQYYNYLDKQAPAGMAYYRLKQVDFNGQSTMSKIIELNRGEAMFGFNEVYPVPARDFVEVSFNANSNVPIYISVHDLVGSEIGSFNIDAFEGTNSFRIQIDTFSTGIYFISLNNGEEVITNRFIKE